ncbi:metal-sensitive transcriptional regulator [Domibacillus epiphyticus]|uniref:Cytoplasmic protein n=1 Tax=Domibacillus epiphyticus TaxID=1714355 RepID=A0A1V2A8J8_9BACI|nr:metal-sensitive transcriptional regulator [Domibacillus epiphyticus]OMP67144.1 cytoplasmic protein [Domibacillus epiphyticus]
MQTYNRDVKNRLSRIEGQVRGVIKMVDEEKDCRDVVTQLSAIRSAVDRSIGLIVAQNLEACIRDAHESGQNADDAIAEAVNMIVKSR